MTSSLLIKILKIAKISDFSCDKDYNSRTDVFRDFISLIINQCDPRRPKGASGGHSVRQPRSASKRSAIVHLKLQKDSTNRTLVSVLHLH